jgi:hypothetical protein
MPNSSKSLDCAESNIAVLGIDLGKSTFHSTGFDRLG